MMAKQPKSDNIKERILSLPLEYCKLDRASRLLECDVEDIIHWGAIGAIKLCYWLDNEEVLMAFLTYVEKEKKEIIEGQLQIGFSFTPYSHVMSENPDSLKFTAWGLWPLTSSCIHALERCKPLTKNNLEFFAQNQKENIEVLFSLPISRPKENDDLDSPISINDLWIIKPDLEKLVTAIKDSNSLLPNVYNSDEVYQTAMRQDKSQPALGIIKPHPQTELSAVKREQILAAALYVKENDTDLCGNTITDWANAISEKAELFWPEKKEPPLSREKIIDIISAAKNSGMPSIKK